MIKILGLYVFLVFCWIQYLAIMNLSRYRDQLSPVAKFHAYFVLLPVGYFCDAVLNGIVCLCFWRVPKDLLLTGTLKRTINTDDGWRGLTAAWICQNLLNQFDPKGSHCG